MTNSEKKDIILTSLEDTYNSLVDLMDDPQEYPATVEWATIQSEKVDEVICWVENTDFSKICQCKQSQ
jgi:hypothetical protein